MDERRRQHNPMHWEMIELTTLCIIAKQPARPTELKSVLGLTSGGISKLLDRMEQTGLVKRKFGEVLTDLRGVRVVITRKGRVELRTFAESLFEYANEELVKLADQIRESAWAIELSPKTNADATAELIVDLQRVVALVAAVAEGRDPLKPRGR